VPVLQVQGLSFAYASRLKPALVDVGFGVVPGETVLVLGPSGSGKSTLTLCLDGLIPHLIEGEYAGRVTVAGLVVQNTPVHLLAQRVGLVFQDPDSQFCTLTVEDEVAFGLENLCVEPRRIDEEVDRALELVGLRAYRYRRLSDLSGGEKQRVALASVLAMGPPLLVLDEPSANLDPRATTELFELLRSLREEHGHTLLIIEHKLDEVIDWVDSVLVLGSDGRLLYRGDPATAFYEMADTLEQAGVWRPQTSELVIALREAGWAVPGRPLGVGETVAALHATPGLFRQLNLLVRRHGGPADVPAADSPPADVPTVVAVSVATPSPETPSPETPSPETPLLDVCDLSFRYPGGEVAVDGVSFSLQAGSFVALAGANGAGKTTLASLISGVLTPPAGTVWLQGRDVSRLSPGELGAQVGHVFQNPEHQFVTETVRGELIYSLSPGAGRRRNPHLPPEQRELVDAWLEKLGLLALAEANPFSLSHGQKRRLSVAAMLIRRQALLILDEPTLGQDERQVAHLMALMQGFQAAGGTVLMITHDMRLVAEYADRLLVLKRGRLVHDGSPAEFLSRPALVEEAGLRVPVLSTVWTALLGRLDAGIIVLSAVFPHTVRAFAAALDRRAVPALSGEGG